jgi:hypothetical protein
MEGVCQSLDAGDNNTRVEEFCLHDPFSNRGWSSEPPPSSPTTTIDSDSSTLVPHKNNNDEHFQSKKEAIEAYKIKLEEKYNMFFDGILKNVSMFSGFDEEEETNESVKTTADMIEYFENL